MYNDITILPNSGKTIKHFLPYFSMGYSAKAIANYFLDRYGDMKTSPKISPLKLQKLVYISHGWSLAILNEELVKDEYAEAWRYGPVFPSLYYEFKEFGKRPINRNATDLNFLSDLEYITPRVEVSDEQNHALLNRIWDVYGEYTSVQLSNMTHKEGTPWWKAWNEAKGMRNFHIDNKIIKKYYSELANG